MADNSVRTAGVVWALSTLMAASTSAGPLRIGGEFQVNSYTTNTQWSPQVEMDTSGDFAVVWSSVQDGSSFGVFGKRYDSAGIVLATEFQINKYTTGAQTDPGIAMASDGDFVVVWESENQDGSEYGAFGRRVRRATGALAGNEFQVNSSTAGDQYHAEAGMQSDGSFAVAWNRSGNEVLGARFDPLNAELGDEFQVNAHTTGSQDFADVAMDSDGDFVVAWHSAGQDGNLNGVFARRFSSAGAAVSAEFQVNSYTPGNQQSPAIDMEASGDFVIVWNSLSQDGGTGGGVFGKRYSSSGADSGRRVPSLGPYRGIDGFPCHQPRSRRRLRGGVGKRLRRPGQRCIRPALQQLGRRAGGRLPSEHAHRKRPADTHAGAGR